MPSPQPCSLNASPMVKTLLERLARSRQKPASLVRRSQLILAMLAGANNAQAARQFKLHLDTPRLWHNRWSLDITPHLLQLEAALLASEEVNLGQHLELLLADEPRPVLVHSLLLGRNKSPLLWPWRVKTRL